MKNYHEDPEFNEGDNYENSKVIPIMLAAALAAFAAIALIVGFVSLVLTVIKQW